MAKKKEKKATEVTLDDHKSSYVDASKKLYDLKNEFKLTRKIEKPHLFKQYRKDRARALTAINMNKRNQKGS